ncbi:stromelysin-1 [Acomys russatus]|uniref:stromelysin-1 n=1 Tax=Acomys russatus TaxID=60746 RepID=UPI0021E2C5AE|nr:stromelysin-1 [Acomys russatus]
MKGFPALLWLCVAVCSSYPLHGRAGDEGNGMEILQKYLENYYGLEKDAKQFVKRMGSSPVVSKIREMQKFLGLKMTGKLDSSTMDLMHKPRCGVPDVGGFTTFPGSPKWRKNHITYRIVNYTPDLPRESVDSAIERALRVWEEVTPLTFSRMSEGEADIMISFAVGEHGDFVPFDGPGTVLAHAFAPGLGINGDAHFDDDEQWTEDTTGTNLFLVAAHELGHSLGLFHSAKAEALMYPVYKSSSDLARFHLSQDDVEGIQSLYGPPPASPDVLVVPTEPNSPEPDTSLMCSPALSFDAVSTLRGEVLFFKDRHFWRKSLRTPEPGFHLVSSFWPSLPSNVDAAYEVTNRDTVFIIKGNQYWAIRGHEEQAGYPKSIHTLGLPASVRKIDAAFSSKEKKKTYFFVEDKYWRFDEKKQSMEPGFPRRIAEDFPGIDSKVDGVFEAFGFFYFFSGSSQLEFDPNAKKVTHVLKSNSWFNC